MKAGLWRRSYPEVVHSAHQLWADRRYLEAAKEFWIAAYVAPTDVMETAMLEAAWVASERAQGRSSELETKQ